MAVASALAEPRRAMGQADVPEAPARRGEHDGRAGRQDGQPAPSPVWSALCPPLLSGSHVGEHVTSSSSSERNATPVSSQVVRTSPRYHARGTAFHRLRSGQGCGRLRLGAWRTASRSRSRRGRRRDSTATAMATATAARVRERGTTRATIIPSFLASPRLRLGQGCKRLRREALRTGPTATARATANAMKGESSLSAHRSESQTATARGRRRAGAGAGARRAPAGPSRRGRGPRRLRGCRGGRWR